MKKEYEAFNGVFKFKIATGLDADEQRLEELKELEKELEQEKEKEHKKNDNAKINNDDVPYEARMKYIIQAYKKDQEKWAKLAVYAKHLEGEVVRLKGILIDNGYTDSGASEDWTPDKEIAELKKKIKKLEENIEIKYPAKKQQIFRNKRVMSSQASYIVQLQSLLDKHGIPYMTPKPLKKITQEDIDNIDENAVR